MIWYLKIEIYGNYRELYGIVIGDLWDLKGNFGIIMGIYGICTDMAQLAVTNGSQFLELRLYIMK